MIGAIKITIEPCERGAQEINPLYRGFTLAANVANPFAETNALTGTLVGRKSVTVIPLGTPSATLQRRVRNIAKVIVLAKDGVFDADTTVQTALDALLP